MLKLLGIIVGCFLLSACSQHVNPSWEDGNLSKREHMRRRLERLESSQRNNMGGILRAFVDPAW